MKTKEQWLKEIQALRGTNDVNNPLRKAALAAMNARRLSLAAYAAQKEVIVLSQVIAFGINDELNLGDALNAFAAEMESNL